MIAAPRCTVAKCAPLTLNWRTASRTVSGTS
jgi:hypothetical protein